MNRLVYVTILLVTISVTACDIRSDNWYTSKCELLCDEEKGKFLDIRKLETHKIGVAYDTIQIAKNDSVTITFDIITDCCLDFETSADLRLDTLILQYKLAGDTLSPCDCYCDYRMIYKINKENKDWSTLRIEGTDRY